MRLSGRALVWPRGVEGGTEWSNASVRRRTFRPLRSRGQRHKSSVMLTTHAAFPPPTFSCMRQAEAHNSNPFLRLVLFQDQQFILLSLLLAAVMTLWAY